MAPIRLSRLQLRARRAWGTETPLERRAASHEPNARRAAFSSALAFLATELWFSGSCLLTRARISRRILALVHRRPTRS